MVSAVQSNPEMNAPVLVTKNLKLIPHVPAHLRALIEGADAYEKTSGWAPADGLRELMVSKDVSPEWLAKLETATEPDPWMHGFALIHQATGRVIGMGGFKGPPAVDGIVEVAYGVVPDYQNKGLATEATQALVAFAFGSGLAKVIRAHTLPETNASTRLLAKCGFRHIGEVIDPEDGPVWRWEKEPDGPV